MCGKMREKVCVLRICVVYMRLYYWRVGARVYSVYMRVRLPVPVVQSSISPAPKLLIQ